MHRISFIGGIAATIAVLALAGCLPTAVSVPLGQGVLVAEAGADGVNHAAIAAAPALHGDGARQVRACVDATNNAVTAAHGLYAHGDVGGAKRAVEAAQANIADCWVKTHSTGGVSP